MGRYSKEYLPTQKYKSCELFCSSYPYLHQCTENKDHVKLITRYVWEKYMEKAENIRHTIGRKHINNERKRLSDFSEQQKNNMVSVTLNT